MKKSHSLLNSFVFGNKLVIICVVFTMSTLVDMLLCQLFYNMDSITFWHLWNRFLLCVMVIYSLNIFKYFEKLSLFMMLIIHFFISIFIMLTWVWASSFYLEDIHPNAYLDAVRTVFIIYPIIIIGCILYDIIHTNMINRMLTKRHLEKNK